MLNKISDEKDMSGEVEEIMRLGTYEDGKDRPLKIKMKTQVAAEAILRDSWKLNGKDDMKMVYIRRNMTEEERVKVREMITEAREKNAARSEEEKKKFFWRVRNERLKKWWIGQKTQEN